MRDLEVVVTYNFDAIMNAFHREALGVLLPYDTHWEKRSWWYSQYCVIMLCAAFYNQHRLQVNAVRVLNRETGSYVQREKEWECALVWLLPAFERKDAIARIPLDDPISHAPKLIELMNPNGSLTASMPPPLPKSLSSYQHVPDADFDACHPLFQHRRAHFTHPWPPAGTCQAPTVEGPTLNGPFPAKNQDRTALREVQGELCCARSALHSVRSGFLSSDRIIIFHMHTYTVCGNSWQFRRWMLPLPSTHQVETR